MDKKRLHDLLSDSNANLRATLEGADPELRVHTDTGWRIRDIVGHIATWDREAAKSLRAFQAGSEYSIPDMDEDEDDFNQQAALMQQALSTKQVFTELGKAREDFKAALLDMTPDQFPGDLLFPWGDERGSIAQLVEFLVEHDAEHRDEIAKAIQASRED